MGHFGVFFNELSGCRSEASGEEKELGSGESLWISGPLTRQMSGDHEDSLLVEDLLSLTASALLPP